MTIALAQCLCGVIQIEARLPSLWMAHCHCHRCQRAHGAAFVTWVGFKQDQVSILDLDNQLRWFNYEAMQSDRGFCARCGSSMLFRAARWPGELHITAVNFITPLDREPQAHVNYSSRAPWVSLHDELPRKELNDPE
jgi:hypothetical protein